MPTPKYIINTLLKVLKWLLVIFISFIALVWGAVFIADAFFDNAAKKDSCADFGGAWDYSQNKCQYAPNDPRSKNHY
ncbi:MAG: hypothetical protein RR901_02170 [Acinetobacter sp.]